MPRNATGMVRRIDDLGRIVVPKEIRRVLQIPEGTPMEIFVSEDEIILKKYEPGCIICGSLDGVVDYRGKKTCGECIGELGKIVK